MRKNNTADLQSIENSGLTEIRRLSDSEVSEISEDEISDIVRIDTEEAPLMPLVRISDETTDIDFEIEQNPIYPVNGSAGSDMPVEQILLETTEYYNLDISGSMDLSDNLPTDEISTLSTDEDVIITIEDLDSIEEDDSVDFIHNDASCDGDLDGDFSSEIVLLS